MKTAWFQVRERTLRSASLFLRDCRRHRGVTGGPAESPVVDLRSLRFDGYTGRLKQKAPPSTLEADRVAEPCDDREVDMLEALPESERRFYESEESVLRWEGKSQVLFDEITTQYCFVGGEHSQYLKYFHRPDLPRGLWRWIPATKVAAYAGLSTVAKKDGRQRKILMCCPANYALSDPRSRGDHGLHGGAAFEGMLAPSGVWAVSSFDEDNAFTRVRVPAWLTRWQCAPPVRAWEVWTLLDAETRAEVQPFSWVAPAYQRLAMGSAHSVHILMSINLRITGEALLASARRGLGKGELDVMEPRHESDGEDDPQVTGPEESDPETEEQNDEENVDAEPDAEIMVPEADAQAYSLEGWLREVRSSRRLPGRTFVVMHLFAGHRRREDVEYMTRQWATRSSKRLLFLSADLATDARWDLAQPETFHSLGCLVDEGYVDILVAGPPCSTWSRARHRGRDGPPPVRGRSESPWGFPHLTGALKRQVTEANVLMVNTLSLMERVSRAGGSYLLEHPADPGGEPYPSIWSNEVLIGMMVRTGGQTVSFNQCALGGPTPKPTTLGGTLCGLQEEFGPCVCPGVSAHHRHASSWGRTREGQHRTRALQAYPPMMCASIAKCIAATLEYFEVSGWGAAGWQRGETALPRTNAFSEISGERPAVAVRNEDVLKGQNVLLSQKQAASYLHVDDGVTCAGGAGADQRADELCEMLANSLEDAGFVVSDRQRAAEVQKILGYQPVQKPASLTLPPDKRVQLYDDLMRVARAPKVDVNEVATLLGRWTWGALLRRELLSIPQSIFKFVRLLDDMYTKPWNSVRKELWAMALAVPFMTLRLDLLLSNVLWATDAQGAGEGDSGGYGIVAKPADDDLMQAIWLCGRATGKTVASLPGGGPKRSLGVLEATVPFSRLPPRAFDGPWMDVCAGRWQWSDAIVLGEGRAAVKLVRIIASSPGLHEQVAISLQDNMALAGAWLKGRSPTRELNFLLRERAAGSLASGTRVILPWVETRLQPADDLSRRLPEPFLGGCDEEGFAVEDGETFEC